MRWEKFSRLGGEMSKKAWICGEGDNSLVRAEGDSHNYTFLAMPATTMQLYTNNASH